MQIKNIVRSGKKKINKSRNSFYRNNQFYKNNSQEANMGQLNSCSTADNFNIYQETSSKKKLKFAQQVTFHLQNNPKRNKADCLYSLCHLDINFKNESWKAYLTKKFKESTSKKWPRILERIIKPYKIDKIDTKNQADILWIFYNQPCNPEEENHKEKAKKKIIGSSKHRALYEHYEMNSTFEMTSPQKSDGLDTCEGLTGSSKPKSNDEVMNVSVAGFHDCDSSFESLKAEEEAKGRFSHYENYSIVSAHKPRFRDNVLPDIGQDNVKKYRAAFAMIDKQLGETENIFGRMMKEFERYFCEKYRDGSFVREKEAIENSAMSKNIAQATRDVQEFISAITEAVIQYYFLDKVKKDQDSLGVLLTRDNVISFVTSLVLRGDLYKTIFDLYCFQEIAVEDQYQKSIEKLKEKDPEDFGVPHEYCLNLKTLNHFKKGETEDLELHNIRLTENDDKSSVIINDRNGKMYNGKRPYKEVVSQLKKLSFVTSPTQKLKVLAKVVKLINKSTEKFYKRFGLECGRKLDPDETLSLFVYLLAKSELKNISAHYRIIEKFSTNNVLNSISGYYAVTLQAGMDYVCSLDSKN